MTVPLPLSGAAAAAERLLKSLLAYGLSDVVIAPGSRSQALALAAAELEKSGRIFLHVRTDERSAGFFALGLARETGRAAAVVTTSGTAVANLMPAVMEAANARIPLLVISADRPLELHGIRANQTASQAAIFRAYARFGIDLEIAAAAVPELSYFDSLAGRLHTASKTGPVHLNLRLNEPLSGSGDVPESVSPPEQAYEGGANSQVKAYELGLVETSPAVLDDSLPTVVIAGAGAGRSAEDFAHRAGLPLLAEVVSGARFGRNVINCYQTLLADAETRGAIAQAVVFGYPTLTREVLALLSEPAVRVVVVDAVATSSAGVGLPVYLPAGVSDAELKNRVRVVPDILLPDGFNRDRGRAWLRAWVRADRELLTSRTTAHAPDTALARETGYKERNQYARQELAAMREPVTREMLVERVWQACWPHDRLVFAASRLVRVADRQVPGRPVPVHANRGVAGIDGTVATALGIATASQFGVAARVNGEIAASAGVTRLLIGDLALLHDAGSLALTPGEAQPALQIFVLNDCGGTIFEQLEVKKTASAQAYDRVMRTPHNVVIESLATAYGWKYEKVATRSELDTVLTRQVQDPEIIEVTI
ncbi:2-succinyl-5-enolpyruvyl-6-hydroxy-3-cyclohexene-1-carboxylic-acid synthase [Canibacter zhoujuaniae]|uniref:2-succinyl-5-enolpyruvyl-6-hydroxy-3- cyclohexene-1-carboxylic-acid synthase n=1 Tax=Canibacter zhoujuaniae TaxID=2708343 RepID=UPI0014203201|nr:2-succinyl-5-enolpyruvyl-6-hydroxy-3-cyclohexene-1-carboxylic-acid synthase [Canibacter zhoujuaniae]